jgi:hypothetical protein
MKMSVILHKNFEIIYFEVVVFLCRVSWPVGDAFKHEILSRTLIIPRALNRLPFFAKSHFLEDLGLPAVRLVAYPSGNPREGPLPDTPTHSAGRT